MIQLTGEYLELRPLPEADIPQLHKVYQGTPLYFEGIGDDPQRVTPADVRAQWDAAARGPGRHLLGIYHLVTGLLIGAADVQLGAPRPDAAAVWLLIWGGFQRQGYGQDCMALLEEWLIPGQGVSSLCAITGRNEEALSFLQLQGFQLTDDPATPPVGRGSAVWACW